MKQNKIYIFALLFSIFLYVFYIPFNIQLSLVIIFVVFFIQFILLNKISIKELIPTISIILLELLHTNLILTNLHSYVILIIYFGIVDIYYFILSKSKYKNLKVTVLVVFIISFCVGNLLIYNNKIIKDKGLEICIKTLLERTDSNTKINTNSLKLINDLEIDNNYYKVYDLDGIKYLDELQGIKFKNIRKMKNIDQLSSLNNVKDLKITKGDPSLLLENVRLNNLSRLSLQEVDINNINKITKNVPNIKSLYFCGVKLKDLSFIKNCRSMECIQLFECDINTFEDIDTLSNLKTLKIENCTIQDDTLLNSLYDVDISYIK